MIFEDLHYPSTVSITSTFFLYTETFFVQTRRRIELKLGIYYNVGFNGRLDSLYKKITLHYAESQYNCDTTTEGEQKPP